MVADLAGAETIAREHIAEALLYRAVAERMPAVARCRYGCDGALETPKPAVTAQ